MSGNLQDKKSRQIPPLPRNTHVSILTQIAMYDTVGTTAAAITHRHYFLNNWDFSVCFVSFSRWLSPTILSICTEVPPVPITLQKAYPPCNSSKSVGPPQTPASWNSSSSFRYYIDIPDSTTGLQTPNIKASKRLPNFFFLFFLEQEIFATTHTWEHFNIPKYSCTSPHEFYLQLYVQ